MPVGPEGNAPQPIADYWPSIAWDEWEAAGHHFVRGMINGEGLEIAIPIHLYRPDKTGTVEAAKSKIRRKLQPETAKNLTS